MAKKATGPRASRKRGQHKPARPVKGAPRSYTLSNLHPRMPKRGFHNPFGFTYSVINLEELNVFPAGETVTPDLLRAHGFIRRAKDMIKVLGDGNLTSKLAIHAHAFSASAKEKITAAGGSFEILPQQRIFQS